MSLARAHTWNPGDVLTAQDLNGEFNNILNNPISLVSPTTGTINFNLQAHTNLLPSAITATSGTTNQVLTVVGGVTVFSSAALSGSIVGFASRVRGLTVTVSSSQGATLAFEECTLRTTSTSPTSIAISATSSFGVNLGTAGPAAGGRDQAGVFASTFVHIYAISTGAGSTAPAGLASTNFPFPTMPANYSHVAYMGTYPYSSASTGFTNGAFQNGSLVSYSSQQVVLSAGGATVETAITITGVVPAQALTFKVANSRDGGQLLTYRVQTGIDYYKQLVGINDSAVQEIPSVGRNFFYLLNASGNGLNAALVGYRVPNGGE